MECPRCGNTIKLKSDRQMTEQTVWNMKYRKIFERAGDPIIFFKSNGEISKINKSTEKLTGYSKDELEGERIINFLNGYSKKELEDLKAEPNKHREIKVITKDNKEKIIDARIDKLDDETYFAIMRDVTKHKELAEKDPLTGIYNYRKFYDELEEEIDRSERYEHSLSIIMIVVDNFKKYNDSNGHVEGDKLLKKWPIF